MRLTLVTVGSQGDVQPYVALGQGLQAAGHEVVIATHEVFAPFVRAYGLGFAPVVGNSQAIMQSEAGQMWLESGGNPLRFMRRFTRLLHAEMADMVDDVLAACRECDAVLYSTFATVAHYVAERLQIPAFALPLQPLSRTRAFPNISFGGRSLGGPLNYLSHLVGEQVFWQLLRPLVGEWLERLQLPPESFWGPYKKINEGYRPIMYGFSPQVVPPPPDWGRHVHVTGYWFLEQSGPRWQPPQALVDFLEDGPPPVYVGFGSMALRDPAAMVALVRRSLAMTGLRAVLLRGWGGLDIQDSDARICLVETVPHEWLFPRLAAVVHHAGAGTTAAGFRAGVPTVAVPFFADQYFWAERVRKLGVGPRPLPRAQLTAGRLAGALVAATENGPLKRRAAELAHRIRAERGIVRVLELLHCYLG